MLGRVRHILPDWPKWAVEVLLVMTVLLITTVLLSSLLQTDDATVARDSSATENPNDIKQRSEQRKHFEKFRKQYIAVYLVIMLADWMQGTHMYTLYLSYNVNISALFLTGFLSGAFFAPFLGSAVDKFGRKNSCIVYCLLEIIINVLEHSTDFRTLLVGRVLGGISTNLLFSAFESWMTTQHRKKGFPEEWLSRVYSVASIGNGVTAILAGIVSQILEDSLGHIGPFQGAIALTVLALIMILPWEENYGESSNNAESSLFSQFAQGWKTTFSHPQIWKIGLVQALSEGAMYTFVFMWVPTLLILDPPGGLPTGCIFSAMMMSITIGGMLYPPIQRVFSRYVAKEHLVPEACAASVYFLASASMAVPAALLSKMTAERAGGHLLLVIVASFMVVEGCVGLFIPIAGTLRSKYVPDALQGAILNIFRLPLNAVVVGGTFATDVFEPAMVFKLVSASFLAAACLQGTLLFNPAQQTLKID